jgi:16S rRNA (guanine(1405)-N(7))-methyltransferase
MATRIVDQARVVCEIMNLPKYRGLGLLDDTVRDVVASEFATYDSSALAEKAARKKIHNIVAVYLGNPDYNSAEDGLRKAFSTNNIEIILNCCRETLRTHVSTSERLPEAEFFFQQIFSITGKPQSILDLACGLNPFFFPWMDLPITTNYYAYDIIKPRVEFINLFFSLQNMHQLAEIRDILVMPANVSADVAFIFKEIHRFEQRKRDCSYALYDSLHVKFLVVSLPAQSIHSHHDFSQSYRTLFYKTLHDRSWPVTELTIGNEMIFIVDKRVE